MRKYTKLLVPAVLAVGAMLLTGCDLGASAGDKRVPSTTPNSTSGSAVPAGSTEAGATPAGGGEIDPSDPPVAEGSVDCGRKDMSSGETYRLVVDPGMDGLVNCTVAFEVLADYLRIPANERGEEGTTLANDWDCSIVEEPGKPQLASCTKVNLNGSGWAYQFTAALVK
jgi:hypothetical protein